MKWVELTTNHELLQTTKNKQSIHLRVVDNRPCLIRVGI